MSKKVLILSLMTSALLNITNSFSQSFNHSKELQNSGLKTLELLPVKYSDTGDKSCLNYNNTCLLPLSDKPVISLNNFEFQTFAEERAGIKVYLDDRASKEMKRISKKYLNQNMAILVNGKVVQVPKIKAVLDRRDFELTFNNLNNFDHVLNELKKD